MASASPIETQFAKAVLQKWGKPVNTTTVRNLIGWMRAEGGHTHNQARFNFLNTTQPAPGAGNTGSQGNIKVYRDLGQGVDATVQTLNNGRYGAIAQAVTGDPSMFARAVNSTPWGTKSDFSSIIRSLQVGAVGNESGGQRPADPGAVPPQPPGELPSGQLDTRALMRLLTTTREGVLRGEMPAPTYGKELHRLVAQALPRAAAVQGAQQVGAQATQAAAAVPVDFSGLKMGGGPSDHHNRPLGNWQSDDAYDLMGSPNQQIPAMVTGVVTKISGEPGKGGGLTGYGITVRTPQGDLFFKHLNTKNVKVGQRVTPQTLLGTLDPTVNGGSHLHLGGTNRTQLDYLSRLFTRRR